MLLFTHLQPETDGLVPLGIAVFAAIPITGVVVIAILYALRWWRIARNKRYELPH